MFCIPFIFRSASTAFGLLISCFFIVALATGAGAAGPGHDPGPSPAMSGGYTGPGPALVSVQQALSMPPDSVVSLKGNITQYLGRDDYTFADASGTVAAKIPPHAWMGQYVSASDTVELLGEIKIDRKGTGSHIRAHRVVKQ